MNTDTAVISITKNKIAAAIFLLGISAFMAAGVGTRYIKNVGQPDKILQGDKPQTFTEPYDFHKTEGNPYMLGKITEALRDKLIEAKPGQQLEIVVILREQADLSRTKGNYRKTMKLMREVIERRNRNKNKNAIKNTLERLYREAQIKDVESHTIVNAYSMKGTLDGIRTLDNNTDVALIDIMPEFWIDEYEKTAYDVYEEIKDVNTLEVWGIGYKGDGIKIGIIDTGVYSEHPALKGKIEFVQGGDGSMVPAFLGFQDKIPQYGLTTPYDKDGHGTHVAGIILGGKATGGMGDVDTNKYIGIAPSSTYVAVALAAKFKSYDWIANPDGNIQTDDYPIVINNSYGLDLSESQVYWMNALESLGITMVFSAGNDGSVGLKGLKNYPTLLSVANASSPNFINNLSSVGPAKYLNEFFTKPDISAPGTLILSSFPPIADKPENIYKKISGTSMSAPKVTGAIALMQEAYFKKTGAYLFPAKVKSILQLSAVNMLDDSGKDVKSGSGFLDIKKAVDLALEHGTIKGLITNSAGNVVPFAKLKFTYEKTQYELYGDKDGYYEIAIPYGDYIIEYSKKDHEISTFNAVLNKETKLLEHNAVLASPSAYISYGDKSSQLTFVATVGSQDINTIDIYNSGSGNLIIEAIQSDNAHFIPVQEFPVVVAPYGKSNIIISYSPQEATKENAIITFTSNANNSISITLSGSGNKGLFKEVAEAVNLHYNSNVISQKNAFYFGDSIWTDLNNDDRLDLIFRTDLNTAKMLAMNTENFTYEQPSNFNNVFGNHSEYDLLYSADIDNDGDQDIIAAVCDSWEKEDIKLIVRFNDGTGNFNNEVVVDTGYQSQSNLNQFTVADFNNDGRLDIAAFRLEPGDWGVYVYVQNDVESLSFEKVQWFSIKDKPKNATAIKFQKVYSLDYNNDGYMDILLAGEYSNPNNTGVVFLRNNSNSSFVYDHYVGETYYTDVAMHDYNNDGTTDIYLQVRGTNDGTIAKDFILKNYIDEQGFVTFEKKKVHMFQKLNHMRAQDQ